MNCRRLVLGCIVTFLMVLTQGTSAAQRPNIVLVLADDLGYGDLACYGSKEIHSPNLDRFATEGLRLTSCYAGHPNCSPSRTALMTGRTPTRVGVRNWIPQDSPVHLRKSEVTIAKLLKDAGYATCHVGKWHLNGEFNKPTQPQPSDHGFDHWFSTQNNAGPSHRDPDNFVRNGKPVGQLKGYSSHIVVDEALRWLSESRDKKKPFFLYVCFHEPHEPIATDEKYSKLYKSEDPTFAAHHGNITQLDDAFGRFLKGLDDAQLRENTIVWFTSDNGPAITPAHPHGSAGPLRDKKGSVYEGGIRVPGIIRWPGKVTPASVRDEPVCGVDFLPTICEVTALKPPSDRPLDGASILPVLRGQPMERETPLYWHFNHAFGSPKVAMRVGDWKILATLDRGPMTRPNDITDVGEQTFKQSELAEFSLYNLRRDIGEKTDLANSEPEKLKELKQALEKKYHEVREESPTWPTWEMPAAPNKQSGKGKEGKK